MNIGIILSAILIPAAISLFFSYMQIDRCKQEKRATSENFTVFIPSTVCGLGVIGVIVLLVLMLSFTFFSAERPHFIFYICIGGCLWLPLYLIVKTLTFKVNVKGESITVYSAFRKPYTFTFDEIASALRQVKKNQLKSERIVIKTTGRRRVIVESAEVSYHRFLNKVKEKVAPERLSGF